MFNLRGDQRTNGELSRKEGGKIFGSGSRTPISITVLVKNPKSTGKCNIFYKEVGDYLSREEKLELLKKYGSILNPEMKLTSITPNEDGDWINQRNEAFQNFIPIAPEKKFDEKSKSFFTVYSLGTATNRDSWVYNFSKEKLENNIKITIKHYNDELFLLLSGNSEVPHRDSKLGTWTRDWLNQLNKKRSIELEQEFRIAMYRPFTKQHTYFADDLNQERYQLTKIFPTPQSKNLVICIQGIGSNKEFSVLLVNHVPDLQLQFNGQCFPLYWYEEKENSQGTLFDSTEQDHTRHEAISDFILQRCRIEYGPRVTKEDIFYYVYGLLHSPIYKETFSADLKKMLPRIPLVKDFWEFSKAGRELADIHLNYENQPVLKDLEIQKTGENFKVDKIRFPKKEEKETIIYNSNISIHNIPLEAYNYVVNGKSPIEWIMERYQVKIDEKSNIENNPNLWCKENGNDKYIFNLLLSVITMSVVTLKIVKNLPNITEELS